MPKRQSSSTRAPRPRTLRKILDDDFAAHIAALARNRRARGPRLEGYACLWGDILDRSDRQGQRFETVDRGRLRAALDAPDAQIRLDVNHNDGIILAASGAGHFDLWEDERGLRFYLYPQGDAGAWLTKQLRLGYVTGCSFRSRGDVRSPYVGTTAAGHPLMRTLLIGRLEAVSIMVQPERPAGGGTCGTVRLVDPP